MTSIEDHTGNIVDILRESTAGAQLQRLKPHQLRVPVGVEIHRHGGAQDHTVILHILGHTRILGQLIIHHIGESRKRAVVLKKGVHINDQPCAGHHEDQCRCRKGNDAAPQYLAGCLFFSLFPSFKQTHMRSYPFILMYHSRSPYISCRLMVAVPTPAKRRVLTEVSGFGDASRLRTLSLAVRKLAKNAS